MDKKNKAPSFLSNVLTVIFAQVIVKVMGFVYRMVNSATDGFGNEGNSYYGVGFNIYTALLALSSIGIPNAISKLVAEKCALDDFKGAMRIFKVALMLFFLLGTVLSLGMFFGAEIIAKLAKQPNAVYTIKALAPSVMFVSVSSVIRGFFAGQQNMKATNTSQVLEQLLKCVSSILIVLSMAGGDPVYMAAGATFATTLSTALSLFYLFIFYQTNKKDIKEKIAAAPPIKMKGNTSYIAKAILTVSIPFSLAAIAAAINRLIDTFTVVRCLEPLVGQDKADYFNGILSKMDPLINLPLALTIAFSTVLVPTVAAAFAKKDYNEAKDKISFSLLLSIVISLPCVAGFMALPSPILNVAYSKIPEGAGLLMLLAPTIFFSAMFQTVSASLQGIGKIYIPALSVFAGGIVKLILNLILIPNPNIMIYGAGISAIACQATAFAISFYVLKKNLSMKLSLSKYLIKPLIASAVMGVCVFGISSLLSPILGNVLVTLISVICGVIIYCVMVYAIKLFTREELASLPIIGKKFK